MKEQLYSLLHENNSKNKGINILIPLQQYVEKICMHSTIIPYYVSNEMKGVVSYYNNDSEGEKAFLTLLLIKEDYQGKGLGKFLLEISIKDLKGKGFKYYSLEVLKDNIRAIKLYEAFGFEKNEDRGELWLMEKKLM